MPSGNATFTYGGPEAEVTIQGQAFIKGAPSVVHDNGIIIVLRASPEFTEGDGKPKSAPVALEPEPPESVAIAEGPAPVVEPVSEPEAAPVVVVEPTPAPRPKAAPRKKAAKAV